MSGRAAKLAALGAKLTVYGVKRRAALVKEAAWIRIIQATVGVGAIKAATDVTAAADLTTEVDSFLSE